MKKYFIDLVNNIDNLSKTAIKKEFAPGTPGHVLNARYFYFSPPNSKCADLAVLCGGYEKCAPDFHIDRKDFPFFVAIYTVGGKGTFCIKDTVYPLSYGSLFAFGPHRDYELYSDETSPMEQYFLIFSGRMAGRLLAQSRLEQKGAAKVANPQATLSMLEQLLQNGLSHTDYAHLICCHYLSALLLEQAQHPEQAILSTAYENFQRCKRHLENNFININTSSQLAEECALNIRYIARLFRTYLQMRPYEYLIHLKMNKAVSLLLTTNFNIKQIALMTGIRDPYHFSRIFKKRFQISPTKYRELGFSPLFLAER